MMRFYKAVAVILCLLIALSQLCLAVYASTADEQQIASFLLGFQSEKSLPNWAWVAICGGAGAIGALAVWAVRKRK